MVLTAALRNNRLEDDLMRSPLTSLLFSLNVTLTGCQTEKTIPSGCAKFGVRSLHMHLAFWMRCISMDLPKLAVCLNIDQKSGKLFFRHQNEGRSLNSSCRQNLSFLSSMRSDTIFKCDQERLTRWAQKQHHCERFPSLSNDKEDACNSH